LSRPRFLCIGAAHWDLVGRTTAALPPGADVPGQVARQPGGVAQNVARALAALGRPVRLIASVGRDPAGDALAADLAAAGVDVAWLHRHPGATDTYLAIEGADGALHAGVADCTGLEAAGAAVLAPLLAALPWPCRLVVDGNLPPEALGPALDAVPGAAFVPASPRKLAASAPLLLGRRLTLYLNRAEAEALCGAAFPDSRAAAQAVWARGVAEAVVTDGARPATATDGAALVTLPPPAVSPLSVTGAGDAFVAVHLAARADGLAPEPALAAALDAAARHITERKR
jgi:sugar/nucleoside kinase (ribokinase family)